MGLKQAQIALKSLPNITPYERVIHFGVSGSLTKDLSIQTLIRSSQFHAAGQTSIIMDPLTDFTLPDVNPSIFFSSVNAITDDDSRFKAASSGAQAVDMESYAIAEFCQSNDLPLLALRCISDRAGDSTPKDFPQHFDQASQRLQRYIIKHILKSTKVKL